MGRTYSEAVTAGTRIKGSHVRDLRTYIDEDLNDASVSFSWSWSNWSPSQDSSTRVLAKYYVEMRDAIQALWDAKGRGALPNWTQESPQGPSTGSSTPSRIRASHITDLRAWLNQYEDNHPPFTQGVDSKCYDPSDGRLPIISDAPNNNWTGDVDQLSPAGQPLYVRLRITAPLDPSHPGGSTIDLRSGPSPIPDDYANYISAFQQYESRQMTLFPLFTLSFYRPFGFNTTEDLDDSETSPNYFTNTYTRQFASRVVQFMQYTISHVGNVHDLIVWNEPNNLPPQGNLEYMPAKFFAALLYSTWRSIQSASFSNLNGSSSERPNLYWGGIFTRRDQHTVGQLDYLKDVITEIRTSLILKGKLNSFPWKGINIHMHRVREISGSPQDSLVHEFLKSAVDFQREQGDEGEFIIGEWGVSAADGPDRMTQLYGQIRQSDYEEKDRYTPTVMFYFSHHEFTEPDTGQWGVRNYSIDPSSPSGDWKYFLGDEVGDQWDRFRILMNPE